MKYSTNGRPRRVTDADVAEILAWADSRITCRQLALKLGLSIETVRKVIRYRGSHFKTASPEHRAVGQADRGRKRYGV